MKQLISFSFAILCFVCSGQYVPAKNDWQTKSPDDLGFSSSKVQDVVEFANSNEYSGEKDLRLAILKSFSREPNHTLLGPTKERGGPAGLIIKDGFIICQWGDVERVDMTFSVTKSYLSTTAGLAIEDGLIHSVSDQVNQYVWDGTYRGSHNSEITWEHLLHQTSDWSGTLFGLNDWTDRPDREAHYDDWKYRELKAPGTSFKYNDVRVNLLSYSLLNVWRKPLPQILKERIMDPIGASTTWRWFGYDDSWIDMDGQKMQVVSGGGHHGGGVFINTLDHARFGLLFARNGNWGGKQLISREWTKAIQTPAPAYESYGYMWWLNKGPRNWDGLPDHLFYAAGFGGNFIVVDQEKDIVVVTRWLEPSKIGDLMKLVYQAEE